MDAYDEGDVPYGWSKKKRVAAVSDSGVCLRWAQVCKRRERGVSFAKRLS